MLALIVSLLFYLTVTTAVALVMFGDIKIKRKKKELRERFMSVVSVNHDLRPQLADYREGNHIRYSNINDRMENIVNCDRCAIDTGLRVYMSSGGVVAIVPPRARIVTVCKACREAIRRIIKECSFTFIPNRIYKINKNKTCEGDGENGNNNKNN
jgi:hypothetical protein